MTKYLSLVVVFHGPPSYNKVMRWIFVLIVSFLLSCANKAPEETIEVYEVPLIPFSVQVNSTFLKPSEGTNVVQLGVGRTQRLLEEVNSLLNELNLSRNVKSQGKFVAALPAGTVVGSVQTIVGDPRFTEQLVLCHNDQPYLAVQWSRGSSAVRVMRDFSYSPVRKNTSSLLAQWDYEDSKSGKKLRMQINGRPFSVPSDVVDNRGGEWLTQRISLLKQSDGHLLVSTALSWEKEKRTEVNKSEPFVVDGFLHGIMRPDGSSKYLVARRYMNSNCAELFEGRVEGSLFCQTNRFSLNDGEQVAPFLESDWDDDLIGMNKDYLKAMKVVEFSSGMFCPRFSGE